MAGVGNRAAILTLSRLANYGLLLISPIILVRLLTVEQFGSYREFLLYASVLQTIAVFSINDSILYCVPAQPACRWRTVRQTAVLIACSSLITVLGLAILDRATGGRIVGSLLLPICLYTLFCSNLDFWDWFWVATDRPGLIFVYTSVRLAARVAVAIVTAALTHNVQMIIWALIAVEALRVLGALVLMRAADRSATEPPLPDPWREQLRYCVPSGTASVLATLNRNLSSLVVTKALGVVAFAQYTIGKFGEPVVLTVRNWSPRSCCRRWSGAIATRASIRSRSGGEPLCSTPILLLPVVVVVWRYALPLVTTVFGRSYAPAALVLQIYLLVVVRECFDFARRCAPSIEHGRWSRAASPRSWPARSCWWC